MSVVKSVDSVGPVQLEMNLAEGHIQVLPVSALQELDAKTLELETVQKEQAEDNELVQSSERFLESKEELEQIANALEEDLLPQPEISELQNEQTKQLEKQPLDEGLDEKLLEEQQNEVNQKEQLEIPTKESQNKDPDEGIDQTPLENRQNEELQRQQLEDCDKKQTEDSLKLDESPLEAVEERLERLPDEKLDEEQEIRVCENENEQELSQLENTEEARREIVEQPEKDEDGKTLAIDQKEVEQSKDVHLTEPDNRVENTENNPCQVSGEEQTDLPNETVRQTLRKLLEKLWPDRISTEFELERASAKGDNYLGVVWRICVRPEGSLVLKLPPQNSVRRKQFFARPCFLRESLAYENFLPLVAEFQGERNVPHEEQFTQYARCHACRLDEPNECIVLEDLCRAGYDLHDRFAELPVECVRLVMRAYGKLHATSLAIKQQWPDRLKDCQSLVDIFEQRRDDHSLGVYFKNLKQSALGSLCPVKDHHYVERLEAYFGLGTFFELLLPLIGGKNCEPYAVVCHGDCWNNNIMYRLSKPEQDNDDKGGRPLDVRLIDWQLMRYASPITDLAYFFFSCTSRDFRGKYYKSMLETYYTEMAQQLTRLGESADELFPLQAFNEQLQSKCAVGLLLAMMVLPIVTMRGQDVPDLQTISELIEAGGTTSLKGAGFLGSGNEVLYKKRMRDVIMDCVDNEYI
ncbi:uncharacterized protein Dwil_GK25686 [Drosophila willistoni]|uniref:CHK kinase-like domain-containing protein n=1 Tax=Drosophila willistoni TaxID=7260 RepID=B4NER2_DROWI|nr:uncharacterized protein LOC6649232 [Drosophila willistoni]EDW82231.1 uncharacterized protein Dwil_GK25686 [Drosophila willistoni]